MKRRPIDERAASIVMAAPAGRRLSPRERALLDARSVGHLILFRRNLRDREEVRELAREARARIGRRALVAVDQEGGIVAAAADVAGRPPSAMHLGAEGNAARVRAIARHQAALLRAVGIDMVLAPVLDVQSPDWSRVIGTRSFGGRPEGVGRLGAAAVRGTLAGGAVPVGKHFPGHGGVPADSHVTLPIDRRTRPALLGADLPPFRAAFRAGLPAVMIAHVAYPSLGTGRLPATVSPDVVRGLLREKMGFEGVAMSDALEMAGFPGEKMIPAALQAGIDLFCVSRSIAAGRRVAEILTAALGSGEIEEARLEEAARRVGALARRVPPRARPGEAPAGPEERGIVRVGRGPFRPIGRRPWIAFLPRRLDGRLPAPLDLSEVERRLGERFVQGSIALYGPDPAPAEALELVRRARGRDVVLALLGRGEVPRGQERLLRALTGRAERLLPVALLDPGPLALFRGERLFTFDFRAETLAALFEVLLGKKRASGTLPVSFR